MIFLDSSFILAIFNENDENHETSRELLELTPSLFNQKKSYKQYSIDRSVKQN